MLKTPYQNAEHDYKTTILLYYNFIFNYVAGQKQE